MIGKERIYVIACGVLAVDIRRIAREMGLEFGSLFLEGGLHEKPTELRGRLQTAIDETSASGRWDRIVVGYGVCGRGAVGIRAREIPLAIPRVHDCISLYLGGNAAYQKEFKRFPGTYYISAGWCEEKTEPLTQKRAYALLGDRRIYFDELEKKYGKESARETFDFLNSWKRNYQRAAFIDMGAGDNLKYIQYAKDMAGKYGWRYEKLQGNPVFLSKLLTTRKTTAEILVAPPGHVTVFSPQKGGLTANPILADASTPRETRKKVIELHAPPSKPERPLRFGLGIDAGGTYTDAVIHDPGSRKMLCKSKALTTKWDFTIGVREALAGLDKMLLSRIELASVSTTLATNAIVEGEGQKVGLLIMPPYGLFENNDIPHEPKAVIPGRLEISGEVVAPVDEDLVRRTAREMVDHGGVEAFAVSGYAGCVNPEHELRVKKIVMEETGRLATCGHELSDLLNFRTRAETAVLNARIVPRLARLIRDLKRALHDLGVDAPVMVVKGDGSLMSGAMAMERPVETILSGPAASEAGARFLTGENNATVVDMGGTTTDTATLALGKVRLAESGSNVGGARTHVKALEIRTTGLGGDSLISYAAGEFFVGPRRVAPMAWLGQKRPGPERALNYLRRRLHILSGSSGTVQFFTLTGHDRGLKLTEPEAGIVALLKQRPHAMDELVDRTEALHAGVLPLARMEENYIIQRCGLTPTDLLHAAGRFTRWDEKTSREVCELFASISGLDVEEMTAMLLEKVARRLALELLKKQLDMETRPDAMEDCDVCRVMIHNMFNGGGKNFDVRFELRQPVIGIGAPISHFLPRAAELLGARAILPEHADVANAIGAITSHIAVRRKLKIKTDQDGGFFIHGLVGARHFPDLDEAENHARQELNRMVLNIARASGTSGTSVEMLSEDRSTRSVQGEEIFLERHIVAELVGKPDIALEPETTGEEIQTRTAEAV